MYQQEDMSLARPLTIGTFGFGALMYGSRKFQKHEAEIYKWASNNPYMAGSESGKKFLKKWGQNLGSNKNYSWKMAGLKNIKDDVAFYFPRFRSPNKIDKAFYTGYKGNLARVWKYPASAGIGSWLMNEELKARGKMEGAIIGAANEAFGIVGARTGGMIGSFAGHILGGQSPIGGYLGFGIGTAVGGILGYSAIAMAEKAAELGRKWTTPETGALFNDSAAAQTMRQRSMLSIRTSQFNIRNELGREALHFAGL